MTQVVDRASHRSAVLHGAPCHHDDAEQRPLFAARDYITGEPFSIARCERCGLSYTLPVPADLDPYYPPTYYGSSRRFVGVVDRLLDFVNGAKARRIGRWYGQGTGKVLEVGCGHGLLLDQLQRLGWQATGTEMSARSGHYARDVLGLDVRTGDLKDLEFDSASFDVVIIWHVLEHLKDPADQLAEIHRVLRPGGLVVIGVPNFGSTEARVARDRWFHLDVPRHLIQFTPSTLTGLMRDAGLAPVKVGFFSPEHDYFSFVQTVQNMLGLRFNTLYGVIRREGAKDRVPAPGSAVPASKLMSLLLAPFLGIAAAVWVPIAALLRRGSAMVVRGRREG